MKIFKLARAGVVLLFAASAPAFAGIPVSVLIDVPAIANQVQTIAQWSKQYQQMVSQIQGLQKQYSAMTGLRSLGQIMNNPALRSYLPEEWAGIYSQLQTGSYPSITGRASTIYSNEGFDSSAVGGRKRQQDVMVANKAMTMEAYKATEARLANINALMVQADAQQDAKGAADLANRMAAEQAMIQNEQVRLNLLVQLQAAEKQLADQQRAREFDTAFAQ
ncbi:P-type DNA transfer protein VirB5 [Duganella rhizosphaerae]|uniref:P-type DNA transfer protein VirB5 n=1 Tax=Duganella rhizosphaerae TaxID=2885763 RepID=UPI0030E888D9